jgi:hypothetical protein
MDATTAALIGLIALALLFDFTNGWRAPSAADLEEATDREHEVPLRAGSGSLAGAARAPLTSKRPDPQRAQAVAAEINEPL